MIRAVSATSYSSHTRRRNACCCRSGRSRRGISSACAARFWDNCPSAFTCPEPAPAHWILRHPPCDRTRRADGCGRRHAGTSREFTLQDSMEQRPPLCFVPRRIRLHQLEHRLLHQIHGIIGISRGDLGHPKRAPFDTGQKSIQRPSPIQSVSPFNRPDRFSRDRPVPRCSRRLHI
jgi:hypothetical protein